MTIDASRNEATDMARGVGGFDRLAKRFSLGFVLEDRDQCGRVDDHQVGNPRSS